MEKEKYKKMAHVVNERSRVMDDLISRQAAIDAVNHGCQEFRGIFAECEKNLNKLPSAQPEPQWIPYNDRPPEKYGKYLVTCASILDHRMVYMLILNYGVIEDVETFLFHNSEDAVPCWYDRDSEWGDVTADNVIAWMPLPEPYRAR